MVKGIGIGDQSWSEVEASVSALRVAVLVLAVVVVHHAVYTIPFTYSEIPGSKNLSPLTAFTR